MLFALPAMNLEEQREERRLTLPERCDKASEIVIGHDGASVVWCHLNDEADRLEDSIPGARQVSGSMDDDEKEELLLAFQAGQLERLITKPKIGCFGLNWQHCSNVVTFASHSWEQYYQAVRRCLRFGQKKPVRVSVITSEGEARVMASLQRKSKAANLMFDSLCKHMADAMHIERVTNFNHEEIVPQWLQSSNFTLSTNAEQNGLHRSKNRIARVVDGSF
jgi:hypothetical protein